MARSKTANKTTANQPAAGVTLDAVAKAIAAKDAAAALLAALDAWRTTRSPELANLIDVLDTRIAFPPIGDDLEWTEVAFSKNPLALGRLLSMIGELPVSFLPTAVGKLAAFSDDPRIGTAAAGWILEPPTLSTSTYPFWTGVYKLLERIGDTRVIPAITKRRKMAQPKTKKWAGDKNPKPSQFWDKFYTALEKTKVTLAAISPPVADKEIAKLDKLARKLPMAEVKATKPAVTGGTKASRAEKGPALARALAHATKQQLPETIAALLDAWRDKRAPELADLIDRATTLLPNYRDTFPAAPKPAAAAWQAAFDRDPVGELPRLVRHVHVGGAADATDHVVALSTLPDDPRIAMRLAELATNITVSPERGHYWKATWDLIARTRDTRVIAPLRQDFDDFSGTYYDHHRSGKRLLGDFLRTAPPASPLDAADHKAINQLAAALDKITPEHLERERVLVADIVANWEDEAPRLVYADWLIERDHLRGPLIVLSCKQHRDKQLSKSEAKQLSTLRGGFRAPAYPFGSFSDFKHVIDRGLPSQLKVTWNENPITWRYLPGDPLLPCIDVIDFDTPDRRGRPAAEDVARVMLDPSATRLVRVTNLPNNTVNMTSDPRFAPRAAAVRLADALEPLVKARWKRDAQNFLRI